MLRRGRNSVSRNIYYFIEVASGRTRVYVCVADRVVCAADYVHRSCFGVLLADKSANPKTRGTPTARGGGWKTSVRGACFIYRRHPSWRRTRRRATPRGNVTAATRLFSRTAGADGWVTHAVGSSGYDEISKNVWRAFVDDAKFPTFERWRK